MWNEECQKAFEKTKTYLLNPYVLVPPVPGRPPLMDLAFDGFSMICKLENMMKQAKKNKQIIT